MYSLYILTASLRILADMSFGTKASRECGCFQQKLPFISNNAHVVYDCDDLLLLTKQHGRVVTKQHGCVVTKQHGRVAL